MASDKDDGGLAFPNLVRTREHGSGRIISVEAVATGGMTLRQWYAGKAMQAGRVNGMSFSSEEIARGAAKDADALIAELKK